MVKEGLGTREFEMESKAIEVQENEDTMTKNKYTLDGSVDFKGNPAIKAKSGGWVAGMLLLVNQGLATLAFFGVSVNLVLFLTRVMQQNNADAANNVSKWTGTVYIFSLIGAFLSDSYWGRFKTCAIFQLIFVMGLVLLSFSSHLLLTSTPHSKMDVGLFYLSIYLVAFGNGGYQPNIATFGSDQFDIEDTNEAKSKISFFSYFYLALNLGSLLSNTFLSYIEDHNMWALGFWASAASAFVALVLFLSGTRRYRHFKPSGNPLTRICQVLVAASRKLRINMPPGSDYLYEVDDKEVQGIRKMLHTDGFRFLDRAALMYSKDFTVHDQTILRDPWQLSTVTQVEEVKCVLRLIPIWLCTLLYSVVFTQMASLFVVQGAAMTTTVKSFSIPPSSMSSFDILSVAAFIMFSRKILYPLICKLKKSQEGLTELQRMGIGLVIAVMAMISAGIVEHFRLKQANVMCQRCDNYVPSSLHIMWQVPQYALIGASEVFMYVGQLEFFNNQAPDGLKSFGSALCMTSMAFGNFLSDFIITVVMNITTAGGKPGWIPEDLNYGHLDWFYFLLAALTSIDFVVYLFCAKWYRCIKLEGKSAQFHGGH